MVTVGDKMYTILYECILKLKLQQPVDTIELAMNLMCSIVYVYVMFVNDHLVIVKNLNMFYTKNSTSLSVKVLSLYKCYEIFTPEA
jgi:hypothetical protein